MRRSATEKLFPPSGWRKNFGGKGLLLTSVRPELYVATDVLEGQTSLGFGMVGFPSVRVWLFPKKRSIHPTLELLDSGRFEGCCLVKATGENAIGDVCIGGELGGPNLIRYGVEKCLPLIKRWVMSSTRVSWGGVPCLSSSRGLTSWHPSSCGFFLARPDCGGIDSTVEYSLEIDLKMDQLKSVFCVLVKWGWRMCIL